MTDRNHYQNHHEERRLREACEQWSGQIQAALKPHPYWRNASARSIDAERSRRLGVPRRILSRWEMFWLGLVTLAVLAEFTGPW